MKKPDRQIIDESLTAWLNDTSATGNKEEAARRIKSAASTLDLSSLNLNKIPPEIGLLTHLTKLCITANQISSLPTEIGLLTRLTELPLSGNNFSSLPTEIGRLTQLTVLSFNMVPLTSIPTEIGRLTQLNELPISYTKITTLPTEIGLLTNLTSLNVANSKLLSLPTQIGKLTKLTKLSLMTNELTFLPTEIGQLTALSFIQIQFNQNLFRLPMTLGEIPGLSALDIIGTAISPSHRDALLAQCRLMRDKEAPNVLPSRLAKWKAFAAIPVTLNTDSLRESQRSTLNEWLFRLEKMKDFANNQPQLAKTVCTIK